MLNGVVLFTSVHLKSRKVPVGAVCGYPNLDASLGGFEWHILFQGWPALKHNHGFIHCDVTMRLAELLQSSWRGDQSLVWLSQDDHGPLLHMELACRCRQNEGIGTLHGIDLEIYNLPLEHTWGGDLKINNHLGMEDGWFPSRCWTQEMPSTIFSHLSNFSGPITNYLRACARGKAIGFVCCLSSLSSSSRKSPYLEF